MKIATIIIALLTLIIPNSYCQETFFIKQKSYECTQVQHLKSSFSHFSGVEGITLRFAKERDQIMMILSIRPGPFNNLNEERIREDVFLYLDDNSVISCYDKNLFDLRDSWAHTVYYLSKTDIDKIKKSNIKQIRYTLGNNTRTKDFTANNYDRYKYDEEAAAKNQEKRKREREVNDKKREAAIKMGLLPPPKRPTSFGDRVASDPKYWQKNVGPMDFSKILNDFLY